MRVASSLLSSLGIVAGRAIPEAADTDLNVPNAVLPVVQVPMPPFKGVSITAGSGGPTTPELDSYVGGYVADRAPAAGAILDTTLRIGQGLWEVTFLVTYVIPAAVTEFTLEGVLGTVSGSGGGALKFFGISAPGAIMFGSKDFQFRIALAKGHSFKIFTSLDNTAGATRLNCSLAWFANKLMD